MNKIPVFRTIGRSYGYAIGGYFKTLGVIWLPTVTLLAVSFYLLRPFHAELLKATPGHPFVPNAQFVRTYFLLQLVNGIVGAIIAVGLTKEVLGLRRGFRFFYAGFGAAELRVIIGYFALLILVFILSLAIGFGGGLAIALVTATLRAVLSASQVAPATINIAVGTTGLVIGCGILFLLVYTFVRLTFLFLPVTVVERRIGIIGSWELTRGNFWRIVVIGIAVFLPLAVLSIAAFFALFGVEYLQFAAQHARDEAAVQAYMLKRVAGLWTSFPVFAVAGLLLSPLLYGLIFAPSAYAYRALVPPPVEDRPQPEPSKQEEPAIPKEIEEIIGPVKEEGHAD